MATSAGNIPISATFAAAQLEKDVLSALNRIQSKSNLSLNTRNFSQPLGKITGLANEFQKSLEASNARVVAFGASAGLIFAVQKSFSALVNTTIEVEKSLTDINIVLNTSSKGIKQFGDELFNVAKNTGSAFKDVASAATEFSRQGLGLEETLKRTRDALILTRLSGLDVVSSTEALTAAVNSFTKEALTTTDVVNKLAAVDAKFAVSSRDLSEAIQRVGSSASEAGVSFDELLGIVTSVQQTTARGGAVIGNALKTIFTRIERPQVISDLKDFGIAVTDISGNALPTIKVIENLAQSFQNLNPVVKSQVAELVGGVYQINILKAALADVSKQNSAFAEATRTSSQAADEAILKNKALNESLSALLNETTINFTKFATSIGEASVGPGIRKVLGYINSSLESYNEKDAEGVGEKIATGVLSGVTNFITGPGLGIGAFAIGKLLANFTKFAGDATKNLLGLNTLGRQQAVLQSEIGKILSDNPDLIKDIISGSRTRLQVEQQIKQTLIEQAALAEQIKNSSIDIGGRFLASGLRVSEKNTIVGRRSAEGYIPAKQQAAEMVGAMQGGYAPGRVVAAPKSIGGVMNTAETVKYIPGFAQPYILPPQGSRAAQALASKSMAKNGINPYMATGFVPNFIPMPLENDAYGYGDDEWLRRASDRAVPLANIRLDPKYQAAFDPSRPKGERFYRKDGAPFTANDLNHFVRAGAKYGEIREEMPASILMSDKRYGKRKPDGTIFDLDDIRATYAPGKKIEAEQKIKEGIKQVYDPYIPPASMLVFDAMQKSSERDVNEDDLEKTGEMSTKRKTSGRIFKIKSYALNASALNEEKTGLIQKTQDFSRKMTKDLANYIRPGEYSDTSVDNFFGAAGKNYNVLAGTIFEASTNLAANYTRDKANSGGDFDVRGGNIGNIRQLFPGFTDQYGDYKLKNNDEAIRSFIDKVTKQYGQQIGNHFKEQEIKAGSVTSGFKTSSFGFIPNFAPKPFNFRFSSLGEKTAQISPKLRDWLADKYFDPEMASTGTLERLASLNRDSGAFFSSLENPNAVAGIPVRGQQGFVSRQNRGARAGAFLNALRARLPDFVPGSLPNLASGFIPNFAYKIQKPSGSKTAVRQISDLATGSFLRYSPKTYLNRDTGSQEKYLHLGYLESNQTGQGHELFDRFSKIAKRLGVKSYSENLVAQDGRLEKIIPEKTSLEDVVKMAFPQLSYRQKGLSKNTSLSLSYRDYAGFLKYDKVSGKDILSQVQSKLKTLYGSDKESLIQDILLKHIELGEIEDSFSKGFVPNFNAVQEAMGREMAAGYSSSQVKVGQSSKLKTNFNPMGLGVYNSTEGSLNNGIGLAEKAGIDPKTKGMSARGHIPNFADFGGADAFILIAAFGTLSTALKEVAGSFRTLKGSSDSLVKSNISAAASFKQQIGQIPQDFAKKQQAIQDEILNTFANVKPDTLKLQKGATGPLAYGGFTLDPLTNTLSRSKIAASPEQESRLKELRAQSKELNKQEKEQLAAAREGLKQAKENVKQAQAPIFSRASFASGGEADRYVRGIGTQVGLIGSVIANAGGQFISPENKTGRAVASGIGEIASYTGLGAQFGPYGAAAGAVLGVGSMLLKLKDAKAEEAIDKINKSLGETKEKAAEFSGAAQNYSSSLEGLQNALNDPKARPEALVKFQNNLTEALNSIPEEFRNKVISAGTDITKVTEAIGNINKEIANTQKNLERQLAITEFIEKKSSILGRSSLKPKDQEVLNRLFTSSINSEEITKSFTGEKAGENFSNFIDSLKSQAIYNQDIIGPYGSRLGTQPMVNKESAEDIKNQLKEKKFIPEEIINQLDKAFADLDAKALGSLLDSLKKAGINIFDFTKKTKMLGEIASENAKRIKANEDTLKSLSTQYNDLNLLISNQITIEKNRAQTIREINKIQAEGAISIQRSKVKGLLESASPFINESVKSDIQNQLDINEIISKQNSQIRDATDKLFDSFTETVTKKAEAARQTVGPNIESARGDNDIQKQRAVFQNQIKLLTPFITEGLKQINSGGNVSDITQSLKNQIILNTGQGKAFKSEEADLLIQSLDTSFDELKNKLAEIKAQGDIDLEIQRVSKDYQKQSLALNQRLSFAGGAQALGSTGKAGVSDLFDNISELVSELRQTNNIGTAAQKGSSSFKLLDILTNQLQLNRATEAPIPFRDAQSFNAQVSSDLNPLVSTAIAGRVQQLRESLDLARTTTEIQTGKSTAGTALGTAFDIAKEGAVQTALDQIASQFKLENMGSYLDVLQQEARFLNELTIKQNEILAEKLPSSINDSFKEVIESKVGKRLDDLTVSLTGVINNLAKFTSKTRTETDIYNKLPADVSPADRKKIFERIKSSGNLRPTPLTEITPEGDKLIEDQKKKNQEELDKYNEALAVVRKDKETMSGGTSYAGEEALKYIREIRSKYNTDKKSGELSVAEVASKQLNTNNLEKQKPNYQNLSGTYKDFVDRLNADFKTSMEEETLKSVKSLFDEMSRLDAAAPLMSVNPRKDDNLGKSESFQSILDQYPLKGQGAAKGNLPDELLKARQLVDKINNPIANIKQNDNEYKKISSEIEKLLNQKNKSAEQEAQLLQEQIKLRDKTLARENENAKYNFDLFYKTQYGNKFFKDEKAAQANALIESEARQGRVAVGAITEKNTTYNRADFARDTGQLIDTFQTDFKSGIAGAFGEAIKGTKTLKDAFRDMFQGILNRMLDKSLEMGVDALFAFGKAAATGKKDGGLIRGYNSGGMVVGGSGMKDDVPAMMSGGEYVIKKSSVNKYGSDYLRALNGGLVPKYAVGGFSMGPLQNEFLYDNPDRPTSGEFAVDSRLSAAALTDENNPQNRLRQDRYEKLDQYLQDRAQYEKDKQQALKNYKNQVNSTFYSGLTAAAVQLGAAGLTVGAEKLRTGAGNMPSKAQVAQAQKSGVTRNASGQLNMAIGGYIAKFAGGGSTGKDNIPALLMGGEYVMNKKAVDMYGRDFMNQLNTGTLPKYASGGMVGTSYTGGQNTPESSVDELVTALNTLNENLSKGTGITQAESGKISTAGATQESGMSVVNNISINVAQGGEVTSEANATTQNGGSNTNKDQNSIQNNAKLAELLRSKVVEVLVEQKRPGGLLYASR